MAWEAHFMNNLIKKQQNYTLTTLSITLNLWVMSVTGPHSPPRTTPATNTGTQASRLNWSEISSRSDGAAADHQLWFDFDCTVSRLSVNSAAQKYIFRHLTDSTDRNSLSLTRSARVRKPPSARIPASLPVLLEIMMEASEHTWLSLFSPFPLISESFPRVCRCRGL